MSSAFPTGLDGEPTTGDWAFLHAQVRAIEVDLWRYIGAPIPPQRGIYVLGV